MLKKVLFFGVALLVLGQSNICRAQTLEDNWNDLLHYTKIGRLDLAEGYAQAIVESSPDPVRLLELSDSNPQGYSLLMKVKHSMPEDNFAVLIDKILSVIDQGKFIRRADPKIIAEEIRRLNTTKRGQLIALKRLQDAGEYAIPYMLDALADKDRKEETANIIWALGQLSRHAIRPLVSALQTDNTAVKAEIIKALGEISYPQSLAHLKYVAENEQSEELRNLASESIEKIDSAAIKIPAAQLFYKLAENYYYHTDSLAPPKDADFANIWFRNQDEKSLTRQKVSKEYFNELMAMRNCEWALKADPDFGRAIGLWIASFFKAESADMKMPEYFGQGHANASVYAKTAGVEYLHLALARALKDNNAYVALGVTEALAMTAGEKSLFYRVGVEQPLMKALTFEDRSVRLSAAIAVANAEPKSGFPESRFVIANLAQALAKTPLQQGENMNPWNEEIALQYALRAAEALLNLAKTNNPVIDLTSILEVLTDVTNDDSIQMRILAGKILAGINHPDAQRAIGRMAMKQDNPQEVRIEAFHALADSAKQHGSLLSDEMIDAVYRLISSKQADPQLRDVAAVAYGSLNLPSQKVKDLILDQSKS